MIHTVLVLLFCAGLSLVSSWDFYEESNAFAKRFVFSVLNDQKDGVRLMFSKAFSHLFSFSFFRKPSTPIDPFLSSYDYYLVRLKQTADYYPQLRRYNTLVANVAHYTYGTFDQDENAFLSGVLETAPFYPHAFYDTYLSYLADHWNYFASLVFKYTEEGNVLNMPEQFDLQTDTALVRDFFVTTVAPTESSTYMGYILVREYMIKISECIRASQMDNARESDRMRSQYRNLKHLREEIEPILAKINSLAFMTSSPHMMESISHGEYPNGQIPFEKDLRLLETNVNVFNDYYNKHILMLLDKLRHLPSEITVEMTLRITLHTYERIQVNEYISLFRDLLLHTNIMPCFLMETRLLQEYDECANMITVIDTNPYAIHVTSLLNNFFAMLRQETTELDPEPSLIDEIMIVIVTQQKELQLYLQEAKYFDHYHNSWKQQHHETHKIADQVVDFGKGVYEEAEYWFFPGAFDKEKVEELLKEPIERAFFRQKQ